MVTATKDYATECREVQEIVTREIGDSRPWRTVDVGMPPNDPEERVTLKIHWEMARIPKYDGTDIRELVAEALRTFAGTMASLAREIVGDNLGASLYEAAPCYRILACNEVEDVAFQVTNADTDEDARRLVREFLETLAVSGFSFVEGANDDGGKRSTDC